METQPNKCSLCPLARENESRCVRNPWLHREHALALHIGDQAPDLTQLCAHARALLHPDAPGTSRGSYGGPIGRALVAWRLTRYPGCKPGCRDELAGRAVALCARIVLSVSDASFRSSPHPLPRKPGSLDGWSGVLYTCVRVLWTCGRLDEAVAAARCMVRRTERQLRRWDGTPCEVLYGWAGLLLSLVGVLKCLRTTPASQPSSSSITITTTTTTGTPTTPSKAEACPRNEEAAVAASVSPTDTHCVLAVVKDLQLVTRAVCGRLWEFGVQGSRSRQPRYPWPADDEGPHWPLAFSWHGKSYAGAAHGQAGALYALLVAVEHGYFCDGVPVSTLHTSLSEATSTLRRETLHQAVQVFAYIQQGYDSNYPAHYDMPEAEYCGQSYGAVEFCHGACGVTFLWLQAYTVWHDVSFLERARACAQVSWHRGLLRKGHSLCHGVASAGYALLAVARADPEHADAWLLRARALWLEGHRLVPPVDTSEAERDDRGTHLSLMCGLAGRLCWEADLHAAVTQGAGAVLGFPLFADHT